MGDDPVVAGQGEVLDHQVEGGDHRRRSVDHDRLLVCHIEFRIRPLDVDAGVLELLVAFVVGPVAAGPLRVEHDPHVHARLLPVDGRIDQARFGERELLYQQGALRGHDELANRLDAVVGLDDQAGRIGRHRLRMLAPGLCW